VKVTEAITEKIRVDGLIAKPRDARGKGVVENVNGIFERKLSDLPGAFWRSRKVSDQDRHKNSEKFAVVEFEQFMKLLLSAINDYNLYTPVSHLLTEEMIKAKPPVEPNPKAIFVWNRAQRRGDATYDWPPGAIYRNLLESTPVTITSGKVKLGKAEYRSDELSLYYEQANGGPANRVTAPEITVYRFEETDLIIAWDKPDGSLGILEMMDRPEHQYGDAQHWLHRLINRVKNARERVQRTKAARGAMLPVAKELILQNVDGKPRKRIVKGNKRGDRAEANAEILDENFRDNFKRLGLKAEPLSAKERVTSDSLVGYRKSNRYESPEDVDW
jgi:hypothetical protein